jgi:hypothetical protein
VLTIGAVVAGAREGVTDGDVATGVFVDDDLVGHVVVVGTDVSSSLLDSTGVAGSTLLVVVLVSCSGTAIGVDVGTIEAWLSGAALSEELDPPLASLLFRFFDVTRWTVRPTAMDAKAKQQTPNTSLFDGRLLEGAAGCISENEFACWFATLLTALQKSALVRSMSNFSFFVARKRD